MNSAFPEHDTSPVRRLVEDIVTQGVVTEEAADASGSDAYLSSEDTTEFEKIPMPLEPVLVPSPAVQVADLEWDTAGCDLTTESSDKVEMVELVVCANEGNCRLLLCSTRGLSFKNEGLRALFESGAQRVKIFGAASKKEQKLLCPKVSALL